MDTPRLIVFEGIKLSESGDLIGTPWKIGVPAVPMIRSGTDALASFLEVNDGKSALRFARRYGTGLVQRTESEGYLWEPVDHWLSLAIAFKSVADIAHNLRERERLDSTDHFILGPLTTFDLLRPLPALPQRASRSNFVAFARARVGQYLSSLMSQSGVSPQVIWNRPFSEWTLTIRPPSAGYAPGMLPIEEQLDATPRYTLVRQLFEAITMIADSPKCPFCKRRVKRKLCGRIECKRKYWKRRKREERAAARSK